MRFSEVIGQRELKRHLVRGVDAGRVSHAQLFTGRPGAGALPLALAYVQYLNCTNRRDGDSCGECPNCRQIAGLAHPDLHFVFPVNKQGKKSGEAVLSDDFMPLWRQRAKRLFLAAGVVRPPRPGPDSQRGDFGPRSRRYHPQALVQELCRQVQVRDRMASGNDERGGGQQDSENSRRAVGKDALRAGERASRLVAAHDSVTNAGGGRTPADR